SAVFYFKFPFFSQPLSPLPKCLTQKLQSLDRDLIPRRLHAPPNCRSPGNHFDIRCEGFNYHVALIADILERSCNRLPINMIVARRAAIAAARMKMPQQLARLPYRLGLI